MARIKRTKEQKNRRLAEAKKLVKEKFGVKSLPILSKKYLSSRAKDSGKEKLQVKIYAFLGDEGFSFREIGKLSRKSHVAISRIVERSEIKEGLRVKKTKKKDLENLNAKNLIVLEKALFGGAVGVKGPLILNKDSVGQIKVPAGEISVKVKFSSKRKQAPIITITQMNFIEGQYRVSKVTAEGFVIELSKKQEKEVVFNWHGFGRIL